MLIYFISFSSHLIRYVYIFGDIRLHLVVCDIDEQKRPRIVLLSKSLPQKSVNIATTVSTAQINIASSLIPSISPTRSAPIIATSPVKIQARTKPVVVTPAVVPKTAPPLVTIVARGPSEVSGNAKDGTAVMFLERPAQPKAAVVTPPVLLKSTVPVITPTTSVQTEQSVSLSPACMST